MCPLDQRSLYGLTFGQSAWRHLASVFIRLEVLRNNIMCDRRLCCHTWHSFNAISISSIAHCYCASIVRVESSQVKSDGVERYVMMVDREMIESQHNKDYALVAVAAN